MMKGIEFAEVRDAIARAFNSDEFDMFLYERLNFDRPLNVPDGSFRVVVTNVLKQFENEGRDPYLIAEVAAVRPLKAEVQEVYQKYALSLIGANWQEKIEVEKQKALERYGLMPGVDLQRSGKSQFPSPVSATHEGFQKRVRQILPLIDPRAWVAQLIKNEQRVCQIEVNDVPLGTGFLVGPDAVLTNHHVLKDQIQSKSAGKRIKCRFDYRTMTNGIPSSGTLVDLAEKWSEWHLDSSPPISDAAEQAGSPPPTADQLDHALIRLDHSFGDQPIFDKGPVRGWVQVPVTAPLLTTQMPIMILQHPNAQPVKLAFDTESVISVNQNRTRVRYATNTENGASGSPCFSVDWGLVALHHYGEPNQKVAAYNQGIPIDAVHARLARVGAIGALGGVAP
jgi:V8-like Glu-specific endopeptidase